MNTAISMILLKASDPPRPEALVRAWAARWPGAPAPTPPELADGVLSFDLDGAQVFVALMRAPVPWSDLEGPCETSALWPEAAAALRPHAAHWLIVVKGPQAPLALTTLATQLNVAALEAAPSALGVYWGAGGLVLPRDLYIELASRTLPHAPALPLWVDVRVGPGPGGGSAGFTQGMAALGLMEIEAPTSPEAPRALYGRLQGLVGYLVSKGPVIRDGDTIGQDATEKISVSYGPSSFGHEGQVMRLQYTPAPGARPSRRGR